MGELQTTREYDPKDQHLLFLGGSTDSTCAANHDTGKAASPNYILSLGRCDVGHVFWVATEIAHEKWQNLLNVVVQHTLKAPQLAVENRHLQLFVHLTVRPTRSWHRPRHLGLSCHVLCHGLEDAMWWHSAVKQVPAARDPIGTS